MSRSIFPQSWPIPEIDKFNREFFTAGKLVLQECANCKTVQHPPGEICYKCLGMAFQPREVAGVGIIYSYMVVHYATAPDLKDYVPYAIVLVSVDELPDCRIIGNVLNRRPEEVKIGQKVKVVFDEIVDGDETLFMPQWEVIS